MGRAAGWPGAQRRFTGSHERGSHEPEAMPVVSWLDDPVPAIDPDTWRLRVGGTEYTIDDLAALPHDTFPAVLDCTGGWFAEQTWSGVRLDRLIDPAGWRSVGARSATGYTRRYPADALDRTWLVTMVEGAPLSPGHGFPARIVAPGRRGFWWLKWVESLEPSMRPWWVQWPFPVT